MAAFSHITNSCGAGHRQRGAQRPAAFRSVDGALSRGSRCDNFASSPLEARAKALRDAAKLLLQHDAMEG